MLFSASVVMNRSILCRCATMVSVFAVSVVLWYIRKNIVFLLVGDLVMVKVAVLSLTYSWLVVLLVLVTSMAVP